MELAPDLLDDAYRRGKRRSGRSISAGQVAPQVILIHCIHCIHSLTQLLGPGSFRWRASHWRLHFARAIRPVSSAALLQMQTGRGGPCAKFFRAPCSRVLLPQCVLAGIFPAGFANAGMAEPCSVGASLVEGPSKPLIFYARKPSEKSALHQAHPLSPAQSASIQGRTSSPSVYTIPCSSMHTRTVRSGSS